MTRKKRHSAMEIESKLEQADILSSEGQTQNEIAKALGISVMTFHRWRKARRSLPALPYGAQKPSRCFPLIMLQQSIAPLLSFYFTRLLI